MLHIWCFINRYLCAPQLYTSCSGLYVYIASYDYDLTSFVLPRPGEVRVAPRGAPLRLRHMARRLGGPGPGRAAAGAARHRAAGGRGSGDGTELGALEEGHGLFIDVHIHLKTDMIYKYMI